MRFDIANMSVISPQPDQAEDVMEATALDLERFIKAGGTIDFKTWSELNDYSKDVLIGAEFERRVEFCYMIGVAAEKHGPAKIWAMLDEGELLRDTVAEHLAMSAAVEAAERLQKNESVSSGPSDSAQAISGNLARNE